MEIETSLVTEDSSGKTVLEVVFSPPSSQHAVQSGVQEAVVVVVVISASVREAWRLATVLSSSVVERWSSSVAVWSSVVAALLAVSSILVRRLVFSERPGPVG